MKDKIHTTVPENDDIQSQNLTEAERRNREYADIDKEVAEKERREKIYQRNEEMKQHFKDRMDKVESYQSYGSHGLDFTGHEQHAAKVVANTEHESSDIENYTREKNEKKTDKKEGVQQADEKSSKKEVYTDEYMRQAEQHRVELLDLEHNVKSSENKGKRDSSENVVSQRANKDYSVVNKTQEPNGHITIEAGKQAHFKEYIHQSEQQHSGLKSELERKLPDSTMDFKSDQDENNARGLNDTHKQVMAHPTYSEEYMHQAEQQYNGLKSELERKLPDSTIDFKSDQDENNAHELGDTRKKVMAQPTYSEEYMHQAEQHRIELLELEEKKKMSDKNHISGKRFSAYAPKEIVTTSFDENNVSANCRVSRKKTYNNVNENKKVPHLHTNNTDNPRADIDSSRRFNVNTGKYISALSEEKVSSTYMKRFGATLLDGVKQMNKSVIGSFYNISTQEGDYDTIKNFENFRRNALGVVALKGVIGDLPRQVLRGYAATLYTKTTVGNAGRFLKGTNLSKVSSELESLDNFVGPLSSQQRSRYNTLLLEQKKSRYKEFQPTTMKQVNKLRKRVFTNAQYRELVDKYGDLADLSMNEIKQKISVLEQKKKIGVLSNKGAKDLKKLTELKETNKAASAVNGKLIKYSPSKVNCEVRKLKKLKKAGKLNPMLKVQLDKLLEIQELHQTSKSIGKGIKSRRQLANSIKNIFRQTLQKSDENGVQGLIIATDFCTNRYTKNIVKDIVNFNNNMVSFAAGVAKKGIAIVGEKTGATKAVYKQATKVQSKVFNSKPVQTVKTVSQKINGEIYNNARRKIVSTMPNGLKTAVKRTVDTGKKANLVRKNISNGVKRGYSIIKAPFVKINKFFGIVKKIGMGVISSAGVLLVILTVISAVLNSNNATASVIMDDVDNINEYVAYLNELQSEFMGKIADIEEDYASWYIKYNYPHSSNVNNSREILCLAAVYFEQDFSDKGKVKDVLKMLFDKTHSCSSTEARNHMSVEITVDVLAFDDIFGIEVPSLEDPNINFVWDEDKIEWVKTLYNQDWNELYEGLLGMSGLSIGAPMSDAELEALIGSLDEDLSEERKNIVKWACTAVGKIPYHWDWRNYWTIDAEDWGTVVQPDYKGRNLKGLDCSGLVLWAYNKAGFNPTICGWGSTGWTGTIADSGQTKKISASQLQPGDIGMHGSYPYTHTGIYVGNDASGNKMWVHCTGEPTNCTVCNTYSGFTTFYKLKLLD